MLENNNLIIDNLKKLIFGKKIPKNYLKFNILKHDNFDSLKIFKLIIKLETKYKIKFSDNEIFSKKFNNINGISKMIKKKLNEKTL